MCVLFIVFTGFLSRDLWGVSHAPLLFLGPAMRAHFADQGASERLGVHVEGAQPRPRPALVALCPPDCNARTGGLGAQTRFAVRGTALELLLLAAALIVWLMVIIINNKEERKRSWDVKKRECEKKKRFYWDSNPGRRNQNPDASRRGRKCEPTRFNMPSTAVMTDYTIEP